MNSTFYTTKDLADKFSTKVRKENPKPKEKTNILRSGSEVLRDLQRLYIEKGEKLFKK